MIELDIRSAAEMEELGIGLARAVQPGSTIFLHGELGTGKTTLVRGFLRALGHGGSVKSPTFTLVEPYEVGGRRVYHFDLYRLAAGEELEYLGVRDYFDGESICLVEWAERGGGSLPAADLSVDIAYSGPDRHVVLRPATAKGEVLLSGITQAQRSDK